MAHFGRTPQGLASTQRRRIVSVIALACALAAVAVLGSPRTVWAANEPRPSRVVSLNVCTDQLAVQLLPRDRIASVSFLAADPHYSSVVDELGEIPLNRGQAEEILRLAPDLVLAGTYTSRATVRLLRRLGYDVVEVAPPADLQSALAQVRTVAKALGVRDKGEALITEINRQLAAVTANQDTSRRPTAAVYQANGITAGEGDLSHAILRAAGLRNLAAERGLRNLAPLPLEALVMAKPDVLVFVTRHDSAPSQATALLDHPALRHLQDRAAVAVIPPALWNCGGPQLIEAVRRLAAARERALARHMPDAGGTS